MQIFKSINFWALILAVGIDFSHSAVAGDPRFETTEEGIIDSLSRPQTRGFSKTRSMAVPGKGKTRQVEVATENRGVMYVEQVTISNESDELANQWVSS